MKRILFTIIIMLSMSSCVNKQNTEKEKGQTAALLGTWKMIYAEIKENDSLKIKDLTNTTFVKIINDSHFAFFNQENNSSENFYGGGGTYTFNDNTYVETLNFTSVDAIKGHQFPFTVQIKGDSLIQSGIEEVKEAGIKREIIEKYIKIK